MSQNNQITHIRKHGFTIVEMLIVAPIVILVIGVFVTAVVNMTGDVLATRSANALSYSIQDALNRIEQDVDLSGGYLATNNITLAPPQGYNGDATHPSDVTNFHNADATNGTMLILNTYATTSNPLTSTRSLVYASGRPNACGSTSINQNPPVMMNVIYFVKNGTLWRRVVAPSFYATVGCIGGSVGAPWQQPSCAPGASGTICKTQDMRLVDGIASGGFSVSYYPSPSSTTANITASDSGSADGVRQTALQANNTVGVTISAASTVAGRSISQSGTMRTVSPNNNIISSPPPGP
jgi:type II secretory pathway pseudopilin PulG